MLSNLRKSEFNRNILTLLTGSSVSQAIPILASPVIARLYAPQDFGNFALYLSIVAILGAVATGMYEASIVLPEKEGDAINLLGLSILIATFLTIIAFVISFIIKTYFSESINNKVLLNWIYVFPLSIFISGYYQTFSNWALRKKEFKRIALNKISQNSLVVSGNIGGGFLQLGLLSFIWSSIVGQVGALIFLIINCIKKDNINWKAINKSDIIKNSIIYRDFPRINMFHVLGDTVQASILVFVISVFWGGNILGYYAFMMRILRTPLNIIGTSISQVFYQTASDTYNNCGDIHGLLIKTLKNLFLISIPIFTSLILFAPYAFDFLFGYKWAIAGTYSQILAAWLFFNFIYSPVSQLPIILGKQKKYFLIGLSYNLLILLIVIVTGYLKFDIKYSFGILSITMSIFLLITIVWIIKISRNIK